MAEPELIGALIVAARQAMHRAICGRARAHRLTSQQFWALVTIRATPGVTLSALADALLVDAPAASRAVQSLASRGLVELRHDPDDRRRLQLGLTDAGRRLGDRLGAIADAFEVAIVRGMEAPARAELRSALRLVFRNATEFLAEGGVARADVAPAEPPPIARDPDAPAHEPARSVTPPSAAVDAPRRGARGT